MEITYTWKVDGIKTTEVAGEPNFVFQTYWDKTGTDELGNTGTFIGATPFKQDPSQSTFIPFDQLTEEIVLGWIQSLVVNDYERHVNDQIEKQIQQKRTPVGTPELPWGGTNSQTLTTTN
jgi:hypothetical protein